MREVRLSVDKMTAKVDNWTAIVGTSAQATQEFLNFCATPEYAPLRPTGYDAADSVVNVMLFLLHTAPSGFWYLRQTGSPRVSALTFIFKLLGIGMEMYIYHDYIPTAPAASVEEVHRTRYRRRFTYVEVLECLQKARNVGGSSNIVTRMVTGRKDLEAAISSATCLVHRDRMKQAFKGARCLTIQWDPGCYSGKSWNVGMVSTTGCAVGGEICGDIAPKVPEGQYLTWGVTFR